MMHKIKQVVTLIYLLLSPVKLVANKLVSIFKPSLKIKKKPVLPSFNDVLPAANCTLRKQLVAEEA